jgi:type VI secretion system protein ImpM
MTAPAAAAFGRPGLFGKIPAHGDFVRLRAAAPLPRELVLWLEEGSEAAKRERSPCDQVPVRFLFRPAGSTQALVGAMSGSVDKVGRSFPLAIFAAVEGSDLASRFPAMPSSAAAFLAASEVLLAGAPRLSPAELATAAERLPAPGDGALLEADRALRERAGRELGRDFLARVFGEPLRGQPLYAAHCLRMACRAARGREPARAGAILECPVAGDLDRWTWLELVRRGLAWPAAPSFFWTELPRPRLLIALGPAPPRLFGMLWDASRADAKLWPLTTGQPAAIEAARRALEPGVVRALEGDDRSVLEVIAALGGRE